MNDRVQVGDLQQAPQLKVAARPVDTFVKPQKQVSGLATLVGKLSSIDSSLQGLMEQRYQEDLRSYQKTAIEDALRGKDAPEGAHPAYMAKYRNMKGEMAARGEYQSFLIEKWQGSGLTAQDFTSEAEAATAFAEFQTKTRTEFLSTYEGADADWIMGFESQRGAIENSLAGHNIQERLGENRRKFAEATGEKINDILSTVGDSTEIVSQIETLGKVNIGQYGMSGKAFNQATIDAVTDQARLLAQQGKYDEAHTHLALLSKISGGSGSIGRTSYGKHKITEAEGRLLNIQRQNESYAWSRTQQTWAEQDRPAREAAIRFQTENQQHLKDQWEKADLAAEDKEFTELKYASAVVDMVANPGKDFEDLFKELAADTRTAHLVPRLQSVLNSRLDANLKALEDPNEIARLKIRIANGGGIQEVVDLVASRRLSYPHMVDLIDDWSRHKDYQAKKAELPRAVQGLIDRGRARVVRNVSGSDKDASASTQTIATQAMEVYELLMDEYFSDPAADRSYHGVLMKRSEIMKLINEDPSLHAGTDDPAVYNTLGDRQTGNVQPIGYIQPPNKYAKYK